MRNGDRWAACARVVVVEGGVRDDGGILEGAGRWSGQAVGRLSHFCWKELNKDVYQRTDRMKTLKGRQEPYIGIGTTRKQVGSL